MNVRNINTLKKVISAILAFACCLSMGITAFAGTLYSNSSKTVEANSTFNSYLYSPGSGNYVVHMDVTIPGSCYAALMGANSTSGPRYVVAHGDSAVPQEYNNTGSTAVTKGFGAYVPETYDYFAVRLKNKSNSSKTFTDVELSSRAG